MWPSPINLLVVVFPSFKRFLIQRQNTNQCLFWYFQLPCNFYAWRNTALAGTNGNYSRAILYNQLPASIGLPGRSLSLEQNTQDKPLLTCANIKTKASSPYTKNIELVACVEYFFEWSNVEHVVYRKTF